MSENYLLTLARQRDSKRPLWLLAQVHRALHQQLHLRQQWPDKANLWWDLLRFSTGQQSIARWLAEEPAVIQRVHGLATLAGEHALADILGDALLGLPMESATVTFSTIGEEDIEFPLGDAQSTHDGVDWSGTDLAIEMNNDGFLRVLAQLLFDDIDGWRLEPPADTP